MDRYETMYRDVLSNHPASRIKYKNVSLHSNGKCSHPDCKQSVKSCDTCHNTMCNRVRCADVYTIWYELAKHTLCIECNVNITCRSNQMCMKCANHHRYDMIIDCLAVGDYTSSYQPFDIIVNLDYPENDAKWHEITIRPVLKNPCVRDDPSTDSKPMILCGCYDSENELSSRMLHKILSCIAEESKKILIEKRHVPKILIHCTAGISRSSTIAIAYLAQLLGITHQDAYERVKSKRRIIKPNDGFKALLGITLLP